MDEPAEILFESFPLEATVSSSGMDRPVMCRKLIDNCPFFISARKGVGGGEGARTGYNVSNYG